MGRPPCCDKVGIKKGPWTPEEDIILVSYIQEHGPGNWRSVPTNTGLLRCSKSCRLRWTNYLRPGIKRGNFTPHEEGMIIHLQALLGNKWAAIASYLPQRTDNDIKNYWNTHLKKKLKKFQSALDPHNMAPVSLDHSSSLTPTHLASKSSSRSSITAVDFSGSSAALTTHNHHHSTAATATTYASSTENISRLLEGWMRSSPNKTTNNHMITTSSLQPHHDQDLDSILSFHNLNNMGWDKSTCDSADTEDEEDDKEAAAAARAAAAPPSSKSSDVHNNNNTPQLSVLEKWLLDESSGQVVEELMDLSPSIF